MYVEAQFPRHGRGQAASPFQELIDWFDAANDDPEVVLKGWTKLNRLMRSDGKIKGDLAGRLPASDLRRLAPALAKRMAHKAFREWDPADVKTVLQTEGISRQTIEALERVSQLQRVCAWLVANSKGMALGSQRFVTVASTGIKTLLDARILPCDRPPVTDACVDLLARLAAAPTWNGQSAGSAWTVLKAMLEAGAIPTAETQLLPVCDALLDQVLGGKITDWDSHSLSMTSAGLRAMLKHRVGAMDRAQLDAQLHQAGIADPHPVGEWAHATLAARVDALRKRRPPAGQQPDPQLEAAIRQLRLHQACRWLMAQAAAGRIKGWNAQHVSNLWSAVKSLLEGRVVTKGDQGLLPACDRLMREQLGGGITDWKPINVSQAANGMRALLENHAVSLDPQAQAAVLSAVGITDTAAVASWNSQVLDDRLAKLAAQADAAGGVSTQQAAAIRLLRVHKSCRWLLEWMQDGRLEGWAARHLGNLWTFIKVAVEAGALARDGSAVKGACAWLLRSTTTAKGWDSQALANVWAGVRFALEADLASQDDPLLLAACDRLMQEGVRAGLDAWAPEGITQAVRGLRAMPDAGLVDLKAERQLLDHVGIGDRQPVRHWTDNDLKLRLDHLAKVAQHPGAPADRRRDAALRLLRYHASCRGLLAAIPQAHALHWSPKVAAGMWINVKWMLENGIVAKDAPALAAAGACLLQKTADEKAGPLDATAVGTMWTGLKLAVDAAIAGNGDPWMLAACDRLMRSTLGTNLPPGDEATTLSQTFNGLRAMLQAEIVPSDPAVQKSVLSSVGIADTRPVRQWTRKQVTERLAQLDKRRSAHGSASSPGLGAAIRLLALHACCRWALDKVAQGSPGWGAVHRANLWTDLKALLDHGVVSREDGDFRKASDQLTRQDDETTSQDARAASSTWAGARALVEQDIDPRNLPSLQAMCERLMKAALDGGLAQPDSLYLSQMANALRAMAQKDFAETDAGRQRQLLGSAGITDDRPLALWSLEDIGAHRKALAGGSQASARAAWLLLTHESFRWVLRQAASADIGGWDAVRVANLCSFVKVAIERGIVAKDDIELRNACAALADKAADEAIRPWDGQAAANVCTFMSLVVRHGVLARDDVRVRRAYTRIAGEISSARTAGFDTQAIGDIFNALTETLRHAPADGSDQPTLDACDRLLQLSTETAGAEWIAHDVAGTFNGLSMMLERQFGGPGEGKREALKKYLLDKHPSGQWNDADLDKIAQALARHREALGARGESDPVLEQAIRLLRIHQAFRQLLRKVIDSDVHDWSHWVLASVWNGIGAMLRCGVIARDHPLLARAYERLGELGQSLAPPCDAQAAGMVWRALGTLATHGGRGAQDDAVRKARDALLRLVVAEQGIQGWTGAAAADWWDGMTELLRGGGFGAQEGLPRLAFQWLMERPTGELDTSGDLRALASQAAGVTALLETGYIGPGGQVSGEVAAHLLHPLPVSGWSDGQLLERIGALRDTKKDRRSRGAGSDPALDAAIGLLVLHRTGRRLLQEMADPSLAWDAAGLATMWNTLQAMLVQGLVATDDGRVQQACDRLLQLSGGKAVVDVDADAAMFGGIHAMLQTGAALGDAAPLRAALERAMRAARQARLAGWNRSGVVAMWRAIDTALQQGVLAQVDPDELRRLALSSLHRLDHLTRNVALPGEDRGVVNRLSRWLRLLTRSDPIGLPSWQEEAATEHPDEPAPSPARLDEAIREVLAVARRFEQWDRFDVRPRLRLFAVNEMLNCCGAADHREAFKALLGGKTRHDGVKLANQLWTALNRANQYLEGLQEAAASGQQADLLRGAWTIAQYFTGARGLAQLRRQLSVLAEDRRAEYTEKTLDQALARFTGNLLGLLRSILAEPEADLAEWFGTDHCATIVLGLATLVEEEALDLDGVAGPSGPGQAHASNRLVIQRFIAAMAAHWPQDMAARATINGVAAFGKLLDRDAALAKTAEAKAAALRFIDATRRNAPLLRNGGDFVQVLAGLHRMETARVLRLDEEPGLTAVTLVLRQLPIALGPAGDAGRTAAPDWGGVDLATTLAWLGRLLANSPGLAELPEAKQATDAVAARLGSYLGAGADDTDLFVGSQVLAGLLGLERAGLLDQNGTRPALDALLTRLAEWEGGGTDRVASMAMASLAGLMLSNHSLAESALAWKVAGKLIDRMLGNDGLEPFDYSWALLGLHRLQVVRANTRAGKSAGLDIGAAVGLMLQHIATASPNSWRAANLFFTWRALHECVLTYHLVASDDACVEQAACALVTATFSGVLDAATNRHMEPVMRALDEFCRLEVPPAAVWKQAAQALLARAQQTSFADQPMAALNTLSLLRFVLGKGLLDRPEDGWAVYARLWDLCVRTPGDLAYLTRLLNEGTRIDRDWGQHWPSGGKATEGRAGATAPGSKAAAPGATAADAVDKPPVASALGDKSRWRERLVDLALGCEDLVARATLEQRRDLRLLCVAVERLRRAVPRGGTYHEKLGTLQSKHTVLRLNQLLEDRLKDLKGADEFPLTAVELTLVRRYLGITHTPPVELLSEQECERILADAYGRLAGQPALLRPRTADQAFGLVHVTTTGRPIRSKAGHQRPGTQDELIRWRAVSVFQELFGDAVPPPIIVHMRRGDTPDDLPAFIPYKGRWYRTDLLRGSANRGGDGQLPRMIAVEMSVAPLFILFAPAVELRCYMQRLLLFEDEFDPVSQEDVELALALDWLETERLWDALGSLDDADGDLEDEARDALLLEAGLQPSDWQASGDPAPAPRSEASDWWATKYLDMPMSDVPRVLGGTFNVAYVADARAAQLFQLVPGDGYEHLLAQDGCGFIHEDLFAELVKEPMPGLEGGKLTTLVPTPPPMMFPATALQHYRFDAERDREVVYEILEEAKRNLRHRRWSDQIDLTEDVSLKRRTKYDSPLFRIMTTGMPPTVFGTAVPVKGSKLILPKTPFWEKFLEENCPLFLGRHPFDTRQLQVLTRDDFELVPALNGIVVQHSFTTVIAQGGGHGVQGSKGLLLVVPRDRWPQGQGLDKVRLLFPAKDLKAATAFTSRLAKLALQKGLGPGFKDGVRIVEEHGFLGLKELRANLVGVPKDRMDEVAGDYDGDHVLLTAAVRLIKLVKFVLAQGSLRNSKLTKTFTRETTRAGEYAVEKVIQMMTGNLVEDAGTHSMRFGSLGMGPAISGWNYLQEGARSLQDMLSQSLYAALYQGLDVDELRDIAPHADFSALAQAIEPPAKFTFDARDRRHLAVLLGLPEAEFDPDNEEHVWQFMKRELDLLTKAATDFEKTNPDYDAIDTRRTEYAKALNWDPRVPSGVPYGKSLMNRIAGLRAHQHDPALVAEKVREYLLDAFNRAVFHAGLPAAILRETVRWFLGLPSDADLLVQAAGNRHSAQDGTDIAKADAKDAALVAALLSGQSVDFDPDQDRDAVTQALQLAAAGGKARMLEEILRSPLELTLEEFDPEHEALQAALAAGHADCVTVLLDHVRARGGQAGLAKLQDLLAQYGQASAQPASLDEQAVEQAASRLRRTFQPLQPQLQPVARTTRVFQGSWEKSPLGKAFAEHRGKPQTVAGAQQLAHLVTQHPEDLLFASRLELTWLLNTVSGAPGVAKAMTVLADHICTESPGWTGMVVSVRIAALSRHLDVPACREAFVRLAAAVPATVGQVRDADLSQRLSQLGGGLGHAHELVKRGVLPPAWARHVTDAVAALADWICDNADRLGALDTRALAHTINGLGRYRALVPECAPAIRQLAQLVRRTTAAQWGEGRDAAVQLSSLLHGLAEFTSDPTCREAVLHVAPIVERLAGQLQRSDAAVEPLGPPSRWDAGSSPAGEIAISNMLLGLGVHHERAGQPQPLAEAIQALALLLAKESPRRLARFASSSLRKMIEQLAALHERGDQALRTPCGQVLVKLARAMESTRLEGWTAAELASVRDALKLPSVAALGTSQAVDRIQSQLDGMAARIPDDLAGQSTEQLLELWKRLEALPGAGGAIARVKQALQERTRKLASVQVPAATPPAARKERPVSVVETGEPLFNIRRLRTPQKQSIAQHHILIGEQPHLEKYLLGLAGPGRFWRGTTQRKVLGFREAITPDKRYLYTVDQDGVKLALEDAKHENPRRRHGDASLPTRHLHHTNLSARACIGGEVWFSDDGQTVTLNADSGRFGIEDNPKANEVLGTLTLLEWENTIRLWEGFGFTVQPAQRLFTSQSVTGLGPLIQAIEPTSTTQLERIARSMQHAQFRIEPGDAARLAQVLQALPRLPGVCTKSSQHPLEHAGVKLAHRTLGILAAAIRHDKALRFSAEDAQAVRQALEPLANADLDFACRNLVALVEDRMPAASDAQASVTPIVPALPASSAARGTQPASGTAPARPQFPQLNAAAATRELTTRVGRLDSDLRTRLPRGEAGNEDVRAICRLLFELRALDVPQPARAKALETLVRLAMQVVDVAHKGTLLTLARELCRSIPQAAVEDALAALAPRLAERLDELALDQPAEIAATASYLPAALRTRARPAALVIACVAARGIVKQGVQAFDGEQRAQSLAMLRAALAGDPPPQNQRQAIDRAVRTLALAQHRAGPPADEAVAPALKRVQRLQAQLDARTEQDGFDNQDAYEVCVALWSLRQQAVAQPARRTALATLAALAQRVQHAAQASTLLTLARELCMALPDAAVEAALAALAPRLDQQLGEAPLGKATDVSGLPRLMPAALRTAGRPAALAIVCAAARGIVKHGVQAYDPEQRRQLAAMLQEAMATGPLEPKQRQAIAGALQALDTPKDGVMAFESLDELQGAVEAVGAADDLAPAALRAVTARLRLTAFDGPAVPTSTLHQLLSALCALLPLNGGAEALDACAALVQAVGRSGVAADDSAVSTLRTLLADFGGLFSQEPLPEGLHEVYGALAAHLGIGVDEGHEPWTFEGRLALLTWLLDQEPSTPGLPGGGASVKLLTDAAHALSGLGSHGVDTPDVAQAIRRLVQALDPKALAWLATGSNASQLLPQLDPELATWLLAEVIANAASPLEPGPVREGVWQLVRQLALLSGAWQEPPQRQQWDDAGQRGEVLRNLLVTRGQTAVDLELHSDRLNLQILLAAQPSGQAVKVRPSNQGTPVAPLYGMLSLLARSKAAIGANASELAGALITAACNATSAWKASRKDAQDLMTVLLADFAELLDPQTAPNGLHVLWGQMAAQAGLPEPMASDWSQKEPMLDWLARLPAASAGGSVKQWYPAFEKTFETDEGTGCSISVRPVPYEDMEGKVLAHRVHLVVPPREIVRAASAAVQPAVLQVFHAPWLQGDNRRPYYQEAQTNSDCGLHTLNGLNASLKNDDVSLLITKPILNDFIYRTLKARHGQRNYPSGEERIKALRSAYGQATSEYGLEWLVGFNNQHQGEGFPELKAFEELTLDEQGGLRIDEAAQAELDRIADHDQIGLVFAFHREGRTESLGPHIVLLERQDGRIVMRDSRPHGQEIGPYPLEGATMGQAIEDAVRRFGVPHWLARLEKLVDDLPSSGAAGQAGAAVQRALDQFGQSLHTVLKDHRTATGLLQQLQNLKTAVAQAAPEIAAERKRHFKALIMPRLMDALPEALRYVGFFSLAPAEAAEGESLSSQVQQQSSQASGDAAAVQPEKEADALAAQSQPGVQTSASHAPPAPGDLDAACKVVTWYLEHGRADDLGALTQRLADLPAGRFAVGQLVELARTVAAGDRLVESAALRKFMNALADRTAQLVSEGAIAPWASPKSGLLNTLVACLGTRDYQAGNPVPTEIRQLIDTLYLRCNDKPDAGWAGAWSKVNLATRAERCRYVYGLYKNSWLKAGSAKVPADTDARVVGMLAQMLAGDFKMLCMALASATPPSGNLLAALSDTPLTFDEAGIDTAALRSVVASSRPRSAAENELLVRIARRIDQLVSASPTLVVETSTTRGVVRQAQGFRGKATAELSGLLDAGWQSLDPASRSEGKAMLIAAVAKAHLKGTLYDDHPIDKIRQDLANPDERCWFIADCESQLRTNRTGGNKATLDLSGLPLATTERLGRGWRRHTRTRNLRLTLLGSRQEIQAFLGKSGK
jgi:hypothetical protein